MTDTSYKVGEKVIITDAQESGLPVKWNGKAVTLLEIKKHGVYFSWSELESHVDPEITLATFYRCIRKQTKLDKALK